MWFRFQQGFLKDYEAQLSGERLRVIALCKTASVHYACVGDVEVLKSQLMKVRPLTEAFCVSSSIVVIYLL